MVPTVVFYKHPGGYGRRRSEHRGRGSRAQGDQREEPRLGQTPGLYTNFMSRYFTKVGKDFTTSEPGPAYQLQIVMEPDYVLLHGHQHTRLPARFVNRAAFPVAGFRAITTSPRYGKMYQWNGKAYP